MMYCPNQDILEIKEGVFNTYGATTDLNWGYPRPNGMYRLLDNSGFRTEFSRQALEILSYFSPQLNWHGVISSAEIALHGHEKILRVKPSNSLHMFCFLILKSKYYIHYCEHSRWLGTLHWSRI